MTPETKPIFTDPLIHTLGVYVDGLRVHAVLAHTNADSDCRWSANATPSGRSVPPAVLVPAHEGEPPRFDGSWPPHPRGTGEVWPPESRVNADTNPGRYPLAYAWADLLSNRRPPAWAWRYGETERKVEPAIAIAAATRAAQEAAGLTGSLHRPVMVIPNHLSGRLQQALVEAHDRLGCPVRLLWRPVAAAMAWAAKAAVDLAPGTPLTSAGELAVLHLGLDEWEFTSLDMVWNPAGRLVPGRRRPVKGATIPSFGWAALHHNLACVADRRARHGDAGLPVLWKSIWPTMWSTPWATDLIDGLKSGSVDPHDPVGQAIDVWAEELRNVVTGQAVIADVGGRLPRWDGQSALESWVTAARKAISNKPLIGMIVTGPMAALKPDGKTTIGQTQGNRIAPAMAPRTLIEGRDLPLGCLATAAAHFAADAAAGRVAYYDTLPDIRTVIGRDGELVWEPLLQKDDEYVEGGKLWTRSPNLSGLVLRPNTSDLVIVLDHEEHESVREVTASLGDLKLERPEPVSLSVTIEPAAGEARIEVVPERSGLFGRRRIFVEWGTMQRTGLSRQQWIAQQPRVCPPPRPRQASLKMWRAARDEINSFVTAAGVSPQLLSHRLPRLKYALRTRDNDFAGEIHTAVSSNGVPGFAPDDRLLNELLARLLPLFETPPRTMPTWWPELLHVLAGTGSGDERLQRYLTLRLLNQQKLRSPIFDDGELAALGSCLHDPRLIGVFAGVVRNRLVSSIIGVNNWLKAYAEVLQYRHDACRHTDSAVCQSISEHALVVFEQQRQRRNMNFLFRNSALVIVYLLRRRAYDDDYLQPKGRLAMRIKQAFADGIEDIRLRRTDPMGGAVNIPNALQQMIDYIDRKGRGDLLFGVE